MWSMPEGRKDGREQRIGRGKGNKGGTSETVQMSHVMGVSLWSSITAPPDTAGVSTQLLENQLLSQCTWPVHHPFLPLIAGHEVDARRLGTRPMIVA